MCQIVIPFFILTLLSSRRKRLYIFNLCYTIQVKFKKIKDPFVLFSLLHQPTYLFFCSMTTMIRHTIKNTCSTQQTEGIIINTSQFLFDALSFSFLYYSSFVDFFLILLSFHPVHCLFYLSIGHDVIPPHLQSTLTTVNSKLSSLLLQQLSKSQNIFCFLPFFELL